MAEMLRAIFFVLRGAERVFTPSGARAQRGRMERGDKNREGVASGGATTVFSHKILHSKK